MRESKAFRVLGTVLLWRLDPRERARLRVRFFCVALSSLAIPVRLNEPERARLPRGAEDARRLPARSLIVWDVGQGLWTTLSAPGLCWHFDMGGERAPWRALARECKNKLNLVSFTHWDADHVGFAERARKALPGLCLAEAPAGLPPNDRKARMIGRLPPCPARPALAEDLSLALPRPEGKRARAKRPSAGGKSPPSSESNGASRVFLVARSVLISGDSPRAQEKLWSRRLRGSVRALVLGHHGSRTSTGPELLARLPGLQAAIASARKRRYGHPHEAVAARLKRAGVPLVETEIWGSVRWELLENEKLPDRRPNQASARQPL